MGTHYDTLEIRQNSSQEEIKQAYHRLAMEFHPDKNQSPEAAERMKQINEAYQVLSDPVQRARYDTSFFSRPDENIYGRWYSQESDGFGTGSYQPPDFDDDIRSSYARATYESPRHTVVYESATLFSFEHLISSAVAGVAFGIAIATAFIFFGIDPESNYGLATMVLFATVASFLPAFGTVILLRKTLNNESEAGICGSTALAWALPVAVMVGSYARTADAAFMMTCCLLPFVCVIAGWIIGGFIGKMTYAIFKS